MNHCQSQPTSAILLDKINSLRAGFADVLRKHWLTGIECNHEARTDVATCYCSRWRSEPQPSVGEAVERWIEHVLRHVE